MKTTSKLLILTFALMATFICEGQVGIGTISPKTTLHIEGDASSITSADGLLIPSVTISELNAKVGVYSTDEEGAMIYVSDIDTTQTVPQTEEITEKGFYYFDAAEDAWKPISKNDPPAVTTYSIGDFAHGGVVFWVDETGQHGLVCAKEDQSAGVRWFAGTYGNTQAKGDGIYAGKANTSIIIAAHVALGDDGNTYAARICNDLQVTEGGVTYGDWYLPAYKELDVMYQNKAIIDATATANGGSNFASAFYWGSTEFAVDLARVKDFTNDTQVLQVKFSVGPRVRAIRAF